MTTLYEYHHDSTSNYFTYASLIIAQQFTVGAVGANEDNTLTSIHIRGYRVGNPGTVTLNIHNVDGESMPTGGPISTGSFNGNEIGTEMQTIEVSMTPVVLSASTMYILTVSAGEGDIENHFGWGTSTPSCFLAGTEILMADGRVKPIENVIKGDVILGYDTIRLRPATVTETFQHISTKYYRLTFEDGHSLCATGNHPIHREDGYIPVEQVNKGDKITTWQNNTLTTCRLLNIEIKETTVDTYNIRVAETHNYFAQNRLVHNK